MGTTISTVRRTELNAPEVKATTGFTYEHFSNLLENFIRPNDPPGKIVKQERFNRIMNMLYSAVRLRQWQFTTVNAPAEPAFEIWNIKESIRVLVTTKTVEITRGLRQYKVAEGLDASALFTGIKHAQELIKQSMLDQVDNIDDAEFFKPGDEGQEVELDRVLAEDDDQKEDPAVPFVQAAIEKAEPKLCRPTMGQEHVTKRLKSLQGRVLTIVEASLSDKSQREAVKTLVNKEFRREIEKAICFFELPGEGHASADAEEE